MREKIKLKESARQLLRCPCGFKSELKLKDCHYECLKTECKAVFPVVDGIPVLIDESRSVFSIREFVDRENKIMPPSSQVKQAINRWLPGIHLNVNTQTNYQKFVELLREENETSQVLVVGGGEVGKGMDVVLSDPSIESIESDVYFGDRTAVVCDAHDLPFENNSFDGVIVQAVLEHVVDPYHCVEEIYRVLKPKGLVYAETPFMQQVHLGKYDFTRFTHLGHRRLFRKFEEVSSGAAAGTATALAWSYQYFLLSFVKASFAKSLVNLFVRLTAFWLKYLDYYLINKPGTFDAASGYFFLGRRSDRVLSDRELIELYKGSQ